MRTDVLKLLGRGLLSIAVLGFALSAATIRPASTGATFNNTNGEGFDLKIDSESTYNGVLVPSATWTLKNLVPGVDKFFNFDDIKPGDHGEVTVSMHVKKKSAWLCMDFKNLTETDGTESEPESHEDPNGAANGELANEMEFFAWRDDCDNTFERGEKPIFGTSTQTASTVLNNTSYAVADFKNGPACEDNQTRCAGIFWCAGNLTVNVGTAEISCDGSAMGNAAQTDSMSVDISIRAVASGDKPKFSCDNDLNPPPPPPPPPGPPPPPDGFPDFPDFPDFPSFPPPPVFPPPPPGFPDFPPFPSFPNFSF